MKIQELQEMSIKAIKDRCSRLGIERTEETMMIHFMEEFGELAKQIMNKKLKKKEIDLKNVAEELSDCFILLFN
ncbi:MAG: MazG-like family protein, partial [Nanoarchaeota archaeon]|nr:MazG-like family protein [Nanoarchaeota archaeon]